MSRNDEHRPAEWEEADESGVFSARIPPRAGAMKELGIAAVVTLLAVTLPFVFAFIPPLQRFLATLLPALLALALWGYAVVEQQPRATFRIEGGRLTLGRRPFPSHRPVSLPLADLAAVRAVSRTMKSKHTEFAVWDLVVDTRDGASHCVKLAWVSPREAEWMARRLGGLARL